MADLEKYRKKRDPARSPEPVAQPARPGTTPAGARRLFVVQQHAARRMHWDVRLDIEGVLVSFAVPKGPSVDPKEKRLAVQTEDHPIEYAEFEGVIPAGNYGAGAMIVWDRGLYRTIDGADPAEGLASGKLDLYFEGLKLHGRWAFVRIKDRTAQKDANRSWLLFHKLPGRAAPPPEPVVNQPLSILSGLTVEELGEGVTRTEALVEAAEAAGAVRRTLDARKIEPMLAETADAPFARDGWLFELKIDGVRVRAEKRAAGGEVRMFSRRGREVTEIYPEITKAVAHLPVASFVLDGEIAALDERGASSFERIQKRFTLSDRTAIRRAMVEVPVLLFAFDLLAVGGLDTRELPLRARKALLESLVPAVGVVRLASHVEREGLALFELAREQRLEGVVGKRADSKYATGRRSRDWLKVKAPRTADLAVVGYLAGRGSRKDLGSLMVAWRKGGQLVYAGNVGSGLDEATRKSLLETLGTARRSSPAFVFAAEEPERAGREAFFVEPELVAEVRYTETTSAGVLRQPVFVRLRDDKTVEECDAPGEVAAPAPEPQPAPPAPEPLKLSNLDKIFWPEDGYTKGDLLAYYEAIWPFLEPYLKDRPVVLTRYPDGIDGKNFFQKNAPPFTPEWVETFRVEDTDYFICNDRDTLLYVVNSGAIPLHVWSARRGSLDRPDWTILDLDPKGAPRAHVVRIARHIHKLLESLEAPHFIKTSGQEGLHILLPLGATLSHDEAKTLAEVLARVVAQELPDIATVARRPAGREGKVYVDFLQNGFGKLIASIFCVRPRPSAPVSTPIAWREVAPKLDPSAFTIETVPARMRTRDDPMREVLETCVDVPALLAELGGRIGGRAPGS